MTFQIGDRVRVLDSCQYTEQHGWIGEIYAVGYVGRAKGVVWVRFPEEEERYYSAHEIVLEPAILLNADFSLDELSIAEDVISQMG